MCSLQHRLIDNIQRWRCLSYSESFRKTPNRSISQISTFSLYVIELTYKIAWNSNQIKISTLWLRMPRCPMQWAFVATVHDRFIPNLYASFNPCIYKIPATWLASREHRDAANGVSSPCNPCAMATMETCVYYKLLRRWMVSLSEYVWCANIHKYLCRGAYFPPCNLQCIRGVCSKVCNMSNS